MSNKLNSVTFSSSSHAVIKTEFPETPLTGSDEEVVLGTALTDLDPNLKLKTEVEISKQSESESEPILEAVQIIKFEDIDNHVEKPHLNTNSDKHPAEKLISLEKRLTATSLKPWRPAICKTCHTGFPSTELYQHHLRTAHKKERPHVCRYCGKRFARIDKLNVHKAIHDPNRFKGPPKFSCDICNKRYHLKTSLEVHRTRKHFRCKPPKCKTNHISLIEHHSNAVQNPKFEKLTGIHWCPFCERKFQRMHLLKDHMIYHTQETPYICSTCHHEFPLKRILTSHIKKAHKEANLPRPSPVNKSWPCDKCGKVFHQCSKFKEHLRLHTGEKPFQCSGCGKWFRLKTDLNRHAVIHRPLDPTGMRTFKCRICGKEGYRKFSDMRSHRNTVHRRIPYHSEREKPFACGVCGKPHFRRIKAATCALLGHDPNKVHEKMFRCKCPECPSDVIGFHNLSYLRRHWEQEHKELSMPPHMMIGINRYLNADELPPYQIDKEKAEDILLNGIPPEIKTEDRISLFTELELLSIPTELNSQPKPKEDIIFSKKTPEKRECPVCGAKYSTGFNMRRHLWSVHGVHDLPGDEERIRKTQYRKLESLQCKICGLTCTRPYNFRRHLSKVHGVSPMMECENGGAEKVMVNVYDESAVRGVLNYQNVSIRLTRLKKGVIEALPRSNDT